MGQFFADGDWPDEVVDQALKQGILNLLVHFPSVAEDITLTASGYNHNLATYIDDIFGVIDVTHPWDPSMPCCPETPYQLVGRTYIQFTRTEPQVGDTVHVIYRKFYTIGGLEGAETDTLPAEYEPVTVIAACSNLLRRQSMQMPATPTGKGANSVGMQLAQMSVVLLDEAVTGIYGMHANHPNPAWSHMGL